MKDFIFQDILYTYEEIDSTNLQAMRILDLGEAKQCYAILAKRQTSGKGRMNRIWESAIEGNIYFTIAVEEKLIPEEVHSILPLYTAFCIMKAINSSIVKYKWPNDLLIEGEKFCGVLIQKYKGFFIIGIGVNVESFPENQKATSLKKYNLHLTPFEIYNSFTNCATYNASYIINFLKDRFFQTTSISINKGEFVGDFKYITQSGDLVLNNQGQEVVIKVGDVSF